MKGSDDKMELKVKYSELTDNDEIELVESILSDNNSLTNISIRNMYKQFQLIHLLTTYVFPKKDDGLSDLEECFEIIESEKLWVKFVKLFGKTNVSKIEKTLEIRRQEKFYELTQGIEDIVVKMSELLTKFDQKQTEFNSLTENLNKILEDEEKMDLFSNIASKSQLDNIRSGLSKTTKEDILKLKEVNKHG